MKDITVLKRMHAQPSDHKQRQFAAVALLALRHDSSCRRGSREGELTIFRINHTVTAKT